ncbi:uncharacterized protein LOC120180099 isoform X2 [Hibiscus syriacus]|uniref:uncharacterized protein LOC120180099 isoform X2 n=1 Tax=Hibiscus syriacus TaxID=106335 RepID=UPI00192516B0|nr:uncharacterized protein LOC120180099 isoform X2 [Hibiscus syriacus]XP_039041439.1 uncharacterized protein LOC120180099 isoform X2 [Hibiscus syriacus]
MDRYQKVEKPKAETPIDDNEIRITSQGRTQLYHLSRDFASDMATKKPNTSLFVGLNKGHVVTKKELAPRPSNRKGRRIVGLHQITSIGSTDITYMWEPFEEGLLPLETTMHVSMITTTLSKIELNTSSVGFLLCWWLEDR